MFLAVPIFAVGAPLPTIQEATRGLSKQDGFLPIYWDADQSRLLMEAPATQETFLYLPSVASGLGDPRLIGLDRASPGDERLAHFERVGTRVYLVFENARFQNRNGDEALTGSVTESFPTSTAARFDLVAEEAGRLLFEASSFLLSDVIDMAGMLRRAERGDFRLDPDRSRIHLPRTKVFPKNTEVEASLTFVSDRPSEELDEYAPDPRTLTLRIHHSFVALPDDSFRPRRFDPRIGFFPVTFYDYSRSFDEGYVVRNAVRHRLIKKDPEVARSEPVEPIIYYLDRAVPEPYRSAFKEGAGWWNAMFEEAGFVNAFRVEDMPEWMDPLDARYHVIQWMHRTRSGSSVGPSFVDPRTGEIIKAVVRMDSHRSLANYDLYAAMLPALLADGGDRPEGEAEAYVMSRRRQHAAHEVGHTLGLAHNFIAAFDGRASVMAYPSPLIRLVDGRLDISEAYAPGPGAYDATAIRWGYTEVEVDEVAELEAIVDGMRQKGLRFITNPDERGSGSFPEATTWVNGQDAVEELARMIEVRRHVISHFDERAIALGEPLSALRHRFGAAYLFHRLTMGAAVKALGGMEFHYAVRGDSGDPTRLVNAERQRKALELLLDCLEPEELAIPEKVLVLLAPPAFGYRQTIDRRDFTSPAEPAFDQLAIARALATDVLSDILAPPRAARLAAFAHRHPELPTLEEVIGRVVDRTWGEPTSAEGRALRQVVQRAVLDVLIDLADNGEATPEARAAAEWGLRRIATRIGASSEAGIGTESESASAHVQLARADIERYLTQHHRPPRPAERAGFPWPLSLGDQEPFCSMRNPP
jgi:hypothetical protein